jgi:hypothetical protein
VIDKVAAEGYFTKGKEGKTKGEEAFFKQGEKPEVSYHMRTNARGQGIRDLGCPSGRLITD